MSDISPIFDRSLHLSKMKKVLPSANQDKLILYVSNTLLERIQLIMQTFKIEIKSILLVGFSDAIELNLPTCDVTNIGYTDEERIHTSGTFDLIVSNLSLHMVNEIPQTLLQYNNMLNPAGFFLATMFGGKTLKNFRDLLYQTELDIKNGASPKIIPFIDMKDAGALLQKAKFYNVITDIEEVEVSYADPIRLMKHLKEIGQSNCLMQRSKHSLGKEFVNRLRDVPFLTTFEVLTLTGQKKATAA